jgi:hypothetical protein
VFGFADWNGRSHTDNASDVMFSVASNTPVHLGIGKESVTSKPSKGFPYVPAVVYVTAVACGNGLLLAGLHPHLPTAGKCGLPAPNCLAYEARAEALLLWQEIWPGPAMKLVGPLAGGSPGLGLRLVLALEIERHCSADESLQGCLIDLVAFVDVDGAPDISVEAGVE